MESGVFMWAAVLIGAWGLLQILRMTAVAIHDELYLHDIRRKVMIMRNERIQKVLDAGGTVMSRPEDGVVEI